MEGLGKCTREQLLKIAEHYEIELPKTLRKEEMHSTLKTQLGQIGVLPVFPPSVCSKEEEVSSRLRLKSSTSFFLSDFGELTFEQKKEIMLLHHQQESEARAHEERVRSREQEWEFERLKVTTKLREAELELIKEG